MIEDRRNAECVYLDINWILFKIVGQKISTARSLPRMEVVKDAIQDFEELRASALLQALLRTIPLDLILIIFKTKGFYRPITIYLGTGEEFREHLLLSKIKALAVTPAMLLLLQLLFSQLILLKMVFGLLTFRSSRFLTAQVIWETKVAEVDTRIRQCSLPSKTDLFLKGVMPTLKNRAIANKIKGAIK